MVLTMGTTFTPPPRVCLISVNPWDGCLISGTRAALHKGKTAGINGKQGVAVRLHIIPSYAFHKSLTKRREMKKLALLFLAGGVAIIGAPGAQTFTGVVTDTMCGASHEMMQVTPHAKCVRECVRMDPSNYKYALYDGKTAYTQSDQKTPEAYAAQKVKITGRLDQASKVIEVEKIEAAE